ncbi:MAG: ATP-binding protein [Planctomycetota bacterium]
MLRPRLFWSLAASYVAVLLVTAAVVAVLVDRRLEENLLRSLEGMLADECILLEPLAESALGGPGDAEVQAWLEDAGRRSGHRLTLIRPDGVVVADSHEDPRRMGDHRHRPEVVAARERGAGVSVRFSRTVGYEMLYVAHDLRREGASLGVVRVSMPLAAVEAEKRSVRRVIGIGTAAGFVLALGVGLLLARRFTAPIAAMTRVAEDLHRGEYGSRVAVERRDELGTLANVLNRLGRELAERIAALSREDARLRAILAGMVEGVVAVDERDRIAFCNAAARGFLALGDGELQGTELWERTASRELVELIDEARATAATARGELEIVRGDRDRVLAAQASPFAGGGRSGLVVVLHDITELRRLERVRRDFVANVSHELKTPLTAIQGFVETLLGGALHDETNNARFLGRIAANVERLNHLVSDLLSLARIESRADAVHLEPVDWREVLPEVVRRLAEVIERKGLVCEMPAEGEEMRVRGDREAMIQVAGNLLDNAIQYTPAPGMIRIRLRAEGAHVVLEVEDTGIGIPAADLDRVFERFYRVDKARSRGLGGTGLGLSIVKNLVLNMGGEVRVRSVEGEGSTFAVRLPRA